MRVHSANPATRPVFGPPTRRVRREISLISIVFAATALVAAPTAMADTTENLRAAVAEARGAACGPLRSNPVIDQAAAAINKTTDQWINNEARAVPETDALPLLKDLGYDGSHAAILSGAARPDAQAIKAVLLQGYAKIPDCSYSAYGVSAMYNAKKRLTLTTVVLAG